MPRILFVLLLVGTCFITALPTPAVAQGRAASLSITEAISHVGERATVKGLVIQVSHSRNGTVFLDFGGRHPLHIFSAIIYGNAAGEFGEVSSYEGKTISVTGKIRLYNGKPAVILKRPSQLMVY